MVKVGDSEVSVLSAKYELADVSDDKLIGSWTLRDQTNPVLVFQKIN